MSLLSEVSNRQIPLSQGEYAIVSGEDFRKVVKRKWSLAIRRKRRYAETNIKIEGRWKRVLLHRFILGVEPGTKIDHIDGNGLNNRRDNLRVATNNQNAQSAGRRIYKGKRSSRFKGVSWHRKAGKWLAQITYGRQYSYLGLFEVEEDAAHAYDEAARRLHGEFAKTNF